MNETENYEQGQKWLGVAREAFDVKEYAAASAAAAIATAYFAGSQAADTDALRECVDPSGIRFRVGAVKA